MWNQLIFWAIMGPKHLRRFILISLLLMGIVFFAFVEDAFDGSSNRLPAPRMPPHPLPRTSGLVR
jgi:hypothetical protein